MGRDSKGCSFCRVLNSVLCLAFLGAGGYMIWHFVGRPNRDDIKGYWENGFGDFRDVLGNISNFDFGNLYDNDPFLSDNTTSQWPTNGQGGLELELLNALDETWQEEFEVAVSDWENGDPDALTLSVTRGEVDYECKPVSGLQKVCAGNYDDSGWLGINELVQITATREILSSVAKMNEYYLRNADYPKRQYTMCHELGHGFGLPHTDESFTNPPLGNCMDYTNQPEVNMQPDETNFRRLASMYGTVGGRRLRHPSSIELQSRALSASLQEEYEQAMMEIEQLRARRSLGESFDIAGSEWKVVEHNAQGSLYSRQLGEEYTIHAHMLHSSVFD